MEPVRGYLRILSNLTAHGLRIHVRRLMRRCGRISRRESSLSYSLSLLFLVDATGERITIYDPSRGESRPGKCAKAITVFGPLHLRCLPQSDRASGDERRFIPAAADIPTLWARQGLGN